jgi:hypothetical protein
MRIIASLLVILILSSCNYFGNRVEQKVTDDTSCLLCGSLHCLVTYVWYNGEIVESYYDNVYSLNDSIVLVRQKQGKAIIKSLELTK